jgi:hypothetical protein
MGVVDGPVLVDECPRCQEHAQHPYASLDITRRIRLKKLYDEKGPFLSELDRIAATRMAEAQV